METAQVDVVIQDRQTTCVLEFHETACSLQSVHNNLYTDLSTSQVAHTKSRSIWSGRTKLRMALLQDSTDTRLSWDTMLPHALKLVWSQLQLEWTANGQTTTTDALYRKPRYCALQIDQFYLKGFACREREMDRRQGNYIVDQHWLKLTLTGHSEVNNHGNYVPSWQRC